MNKQIVRLTYVALVLIGALVVMTTYWQTWATASLAARQDNAVTRVAEFSIDRGKIVSSGPFALLARNVRRVVGGKTLYFRRYPQGRYTAHVVGYSTVGRSRTGLERSLNDYLTSSNANLSTFLGKTLDQLRGKTVKGNNVVLNLDLAAQKLAFQQLGTKCGAVVAFDPRTGKVRVMVSSPSFDPNRVETNYQSLSRITGDCKPASPLLNRATGGLFIPGSTFKVITASAALESRKFTPDSTFYDPGYCIEYGKQVHNFADQNGPEVFGTITLADGLVNSVNSVYCNIGKKLGARAILDQARRYGFYERPPLETPADERVPSGLYSHGRPYYPSHDSLVDPGRLAFGQERMLVTPLQMAMVAGAIGVGGKVMQPQVVDRIVTPSGNTLVTEHPTMIRRAVSPSTARAIAAMMRDVVLRGTGTAAQIPGYSVGGKTGTAETGIPGSNTTWFIAFASKDPNQPAEIAIAVVLQNQSGVGGTTAAPIAKTVMEALLRPTKNP